MNSSNPRSGPSRTRIGLVAVLAAAVFALVAGSAAAPAQPAGATLSAELAQWLQSAAAGATFETIVTFENREAMAQIESLDVGATTLSQLPIAFATLTAAQITAVGGWDGVRSLWHDQRNELLLDESVGVIGADKVAGGVGLARPYTGAGVGVGVIDTGVDGLHPDLPAGTKVEGYAIAGNPFDREPMAVVPAPTGDTYGHGTHVSSTIAGLGAASGGQYTGVAPGAKIVSFKTDAGAFLLTTYALRAFDWMLENPGKVQVSSNSWGCCAGQDYDPDNPINVATKALYDAGITVVFSAGNSGGPDTLGTYAQSPWVLSAAAGTKSRDLADFSSRGRFSDTNWDRRQAQRTNTGLYRPSVTAPGVDIVAAKSSQAVVMATGTMVSNPMYTSASGTSMSAPHIAGTIALMLEARPALRPQHVIDIIEGTADDMPSYELFEVGTGYLNAYEAVRAAERGKVKFPPPVTGRTPQFTQTSLSAFSGTALTSTWLVRECPDTSGLLSHHEFSVAAGTHAVYTEIEWADPTQLIYLVLYDPSCEVAGESAALLDIGSVNHRALMVTSPEAGTWTVGVYGRLNLPTAYTGAFSTYTKR